MPYSYVITINSSTPSHSLTTKGNDGLCYLNNGIYLCAKSYASEFRDGAITILISFKPFPILLIQLILLIKIWKKFLNIVLELNMKMQVKKKLAKVVQIKKYVKVKRNLIKKNNKNLKEIYKKN